MWGTVISHTLFLTDQGEDAVGEAAAPVQIAVATEVFMVGDTVAAGAQDIAKMTVRRDHVHALEGFAVGFKSTHVDIETDGSQGRRRKHPWNEFRLFFFRRSEVICAGLGYHVAEEVWIFVGDKGCGETAGTGSGNDVVGR